MFTSRLGCVFPAASVSDAKMVSDASQKIVAYKTVSGYVTNWSVTVLPAGCAAEGWRRGGCGGGA